MFQTLGPEICHLMSYILFSSKWHSGQDAALKIPAGKENLGQQDGQHRIDSSVDHHGMTRDEVTAEGRNTNASYERRLEYKGCAAPERVAGHDETGKNPQVDQSLHVP